MRRKINKKTLKVWSPEHAEQVSPIKEHLPRWYKASSPQIFTGKKVPTFNNNSVKACVPFLDAMVSGYSIPLPADVVVEIVNGEPVFTWGTPYAIVEVRPGIVMQQFEIPNGFLKSFPAWKTQAFIELPKGYSALVTHPLNRFDLPFETFSGIVDNHVMFNGSLPFLLREGFEGLIPAGTPIAQVIPFKREAWVSETDPTLSQKAEVNRAKAFGILRGWYREYVWQKKSYE